MSDSTALLRARSLSKVYGDGTHEVQALSAVDLDVSPGSLMIVRGRSGSGKTTLLNLLGGLDSPTSGTVELDGVDLGGLGEAELSDLRRDKLGFIFQAFGLIPILTAMENVEIPLRMNRAETGARRERARDLLDQVGLAERGHHRPHELSGGEQQRVAIARALANSPQVLLADEPTGQLDSRTGKSIIDLIVRLVREEGIAAVVATHDPAHLSMADRVIELRDGHLAAGVAS